MSDPPTIIVLPGADGKAPDLSIFKAGAHDDTRVEAIPYPGWRRSAAATFSGEGLIAELTELVCSIVPEGPIRIVGFSLGGHFGYAVGVRLQARGRDLAGLCAIDAFMVHSSAPSAGWWLRTLAQGIDLLRRRRAGDFIRFARSKFWRILLRFSGGALPVLTRSLGAPWRDAPSSNSLFQEELSMRLLIRGTAGWIASLDDDPVRLNVPTILLRTQRSAGDDAAWRRRCPNITIHDLSGQHESLFEPENYPALHEAFAAATRDWH